VERGRDREGGTGRKIQAGGGGGGDTGDLASARISTEVYATSRLQRRALWGRKNVVSGRSERVGLSNRPAPEEQYQTKVNWSGATLLD